MKKRINKYIQLQKALNNEFIAEGELDFHNTHLPKSYGGHGGVLLPYDIEKLLNEFLEDCHVAGYENVLVIVGKGKVVKPLVQKLLKQHKFVKTFKQAGYFNGQDGAYEVAL